MLYAVVKMVKRGYGEIAKYTVYASTQSIFVKYSNSLCLIGQNNVGKISSDKIQAFLGMISR